MDEDSNVDKDQILSRGRVLQSTCCECPTTPHTANASVSNNSALRGENWNVDEGDCTMQGDCIF